MLVPWIFFFFKGVLFFVVMIRVIFVGMETSQNLQEMSSWTTSYMVGCSRTAPKKPRETSQGLFGKTCRKRSRKKDQKITFLIHGKRKN